MIRLVFLLIASAAWMAAASGGLPRLPVSNADLIYHLSKFVQWPATRPVSGPVVLGLVGNDSMETELVENLQGRLLRGRHVIVRRVSGIEEMRRCDMLFIGSSERANVRYFLNLLKGVQVLTIAAIPGFGQMGGMVELTGERRRRPLAINPSAVRNSGFGLDRSLLNVVDVKRTE